MKSFFGRVAPLWALLAWLSLAAWLSCVASPVLAQPAPVPGAPSAAGPAATAPSELREQTIYIPYKKLRDVFEREGRGVFLPYDRFNELWKAARERDAVAPDDRAPVDSIISEIENEAVVGRDVVSVVSHIKIEVLKEGWNQIPLRLGDAAVTKATIGAEPARLVADPATGYALLIEKKGAAPKSIDLNLEYAKAFTKAPGQNSIAFDAPQAPISKWRVRVPGAGVKVNIRPLLAATEAPADAAADQTVVLAFVGAAASVRIDWTPRAEGAAGLEALATAQVQQQVWIDQGVNRTRAQIAYEISRAQLSQLSFEVPADQKVVSVFDGNVRQWSVAVAEGKQRVTVQLFEPAKGTQNIAVDLERFVGDEAKQNVSVPVIKALGVGRQQGVVVVQVAPALRAEATRHTGLQQLDAGELPTGLAGGKWDFAYRYAALPFDLALAVERVEPRIVVDTLVEATLEPEQLTLNTLALFTIERAGLFRLEFDVPAGYDVRQVTGRAAAGAQAAVVDTHYLDGPGKTHLVVNLSRKAMGKTGLFIELGKKLSEPDLLSPTGKAAEISLAVPRAAPAGVERQTGRLVVYAPESLRVNPGQSLGLRAVPFGEALEGMESTVGQRGGARQSLAFTYTQEPASLVLAAERRKPQVNVHQLLVAQIEPGGATYTATFSYEILYSGVKSLRIDVPAKLAPEIRNRTTGVRERVVDPAPSDLAPGYVAWSLTGDSEFLGNRTVTFTWQRKIEKLDIGKPVELALPVLRPRDADRAWGQIVLTKAETIDVQPSGEPTGVRPIDPQRDLVGERVAAAARAFEFHDDWSLTIAATRYKLEEVKRTSIEQGLVRMVLTRGGETTVHAAFRVRSVRQGLNVKLPDNVEFDTPHPLRLNGRAVSLGQGDTRGLYVIPLAGQRPDEPFLLELRYTVRGAPDLEPPSFPEEPAAQRLVLVAYLPQERALLGRRGPWASEIAWQAPGLLAMLLGGADPRSAPSFWRWKPAAAQNDAVLLADVRQNIPNLSPIADDLRTDGRPYVFSTPRPLAPPAGNLRLVTWDETTLSALVAVVVVLGGLLLLFASAGKKMIAAGLLIVMVFFLGVFVPTFALQVLDGVLLVSAGAVLVIWLVHYFAIVRPRDPLVQARRREAIARREASIANLTKATDAAKSLFAGKKAATATGAAGASPGATPSPGASPDNPLNPPAAGRTDSDKPKE
ncbi:MAG: hypothetical protein NTW19_06520 [Planctomycetota bacterium]|nr:hypothetical protein [Planctomycetota bacterium]